MELREYWFLLRKWLWLIVLAALVAGVAAFVVSRQQTPIYQASTRLLVSQSVSNSVTTQYTDILAAERLSRTYAELLQTKTLIEQAIAQSGWEGVDIDKLEITVQPVRDTQLIDLKVEYPHAEVAAAIANTLPQVFADFTQTQQSARYQESKQTLETQLLALDQSIKETEAAIARAKATEGDAESATLTLLQDRLAQYRSSYSNVLAQLENVRLAEAQATDTITVVQAAEVPDQPVRPRVLMNTLLALIVGGMIGLGAAFLVEYLDDTVKSPDDVGQITGLSTLGVVGYQKRDPEHRPGIITLQHPRSPAAEVYRTVRTGIQFSGIDRPLRSLVITSPGPAEGKSTTASNIAIVMAQAGKKTVLVDADLRKPTQHTRFGLPKGVGLTGALLMDDSFAQLEQVLLPTEVDNLWVLPSGQLPHNPSELLGSQKLAQLTERLLESYDFVIFDSPPTLLVTDPVVLARTMDGVLLVVEAGETRAPALAQTMLEMAKVDAHVVGVVLNKVSARGAAGYYYGYYYHSYYAEDGHDGADGGAQKRRRVRSSQPEPAASSGWKPIVTKLFRRS